MNNVETIPFGVAEVVLEIEIEASIEEVWAGLTGDVTSWWPRDFYAGSEAISFSIEDRLGGRMYEDWGDGQGLIWAMVTGLRRGKMIQLSGELTQDFGGPSRNIMKIELSQDGAATKLRLSDCVFGRVADKGAESMESGWAFLMGDCLKPFVEA
jgi:uncharacterized protein YndB with AHSA1/START domain